MGVVLSFTTDAAEVARARDGLRLSQGPAWWEEIALNFATEFVVEGVNLFATGAQSGTTIMVGPDGDVAGSARRVDFTTAKVPVLNVMTSGRRALSNAIAHGQGTWGVAGDGTVMFTLHGSSITVESTAQKGVQLVAPASEFVKAFEEYRRAATSFVGAELPEMFDDPAWRAAIRAFD